MRVRAVQFFLLVTLEEGLLALGRSFFHLGNVLSLCLTETYLPAGTQG